MSGAEWLEQLVGVGGAVWRASWQGSVLALLIVAVQLIFGKRLSARWRHAMWMLVLVRLALPVVPSSPLSVFNLTNGANAPREVREAREIDRVTHVRFALPAHVAPLAASRIDPLSSAKPQAAQPVQPAPAPNLWTGWPQVLACVWIAGALLLALRIAWATLRVSRMMRRLDHIDDAATLAVLLATGDELNVHRLPTLLAGDGLFSPALVGFVRPRLLVPRDLLTRFDACELRLIFLHELAHLKRRDVAINWAATLLTVLHWMNPIVWLVAWRLRLERELACDELVLSRTSETDRRAYGHTIVKLLETFSRDAKPLPGGVGILEGKQQMKRRIIMIAQFANSGRTWTVVAALLVLTLGLVALTDAVQAEEPQPSTRPAPARREAGPGVADRVVDELTEMRRSALEVLETAPAANAKIKPGDLVTVSAMHIAGEGVETVKTSRVDADGKLRLPQGQIMKAAGLSPVQLEAEVAKRFGNMSSVSLPERGESHRLAAHRQPGPVPGAAVDGGQVLLGGLGMDPAMPGESLPGPPVDPAMKAVLDKKLPEVKFEGIPLTDVIDALRDVTSSNIFVNWRAIEAAGIDRGAPVSLNLRDVAFKDVLALVLKEQGGGLAYRIENGVITIDAPDRALPPTKLVIRAYDVGDLATDYTREGQPSRSVNDLGLVILSNVEPNSWIKNGGTGSISVFASKIIITASESVHADVQKLLKILRETPATQPSARPGDSEPNDATLMLEPLTRTRRAPQPGQEPR
ncbi:MAG: M56 family metallopeptidase [Tepidisphaeraceae bacterium]